MKSNPVKENPIGSAKFYTTQYLRFHSAYNLEFLLETKSTNYLQVAMLLKAERYTIHQSRPYVMTLLVKFGILNNNFIRFNYPTKLIFRLVIPRKRYNIISEAYL